MKKKIWQYENVGARFTGTTIYQDSFQAPTKEELTNIKWAVKPCEKASKSYTFKLLEILILQIKTKQLGQSNSAENIYTNRATLQSYYVGMSYKRSISNTMCTCRRQQCTTLKNKILAIPLFSFSNVLFVSNKYAYADRVNLPLAITTFVFG